MPNNKIQQHIDALDHSDKAISTHARQWLIHEGAHCLPTLLAALNNSNANIASEIISVIGHYGRAATSAIEVLIVVSQSQNPILRARAVAALGLIGAKPDICLASLTERLNDSDVRVRRLAVAAIGNFGKRARCTAKVLIKIADGDCDAVVREFAVTTLNDIGPLHKSLVPSLTKTLETSDPYSRWTLHRLLNKINQDTDKTAVE